MKKQPRKPILLESEEKYWRSSKGNRRVRKERHMRAVMRWGGIFLANSLIAGGLVWCGIHATGALLGGDEFAIETFRVEQTERASQRNILARLNYVYSGENIFSVNLYEIERLVMMDPWVESAAVKRRFPDGLRIRVTERRPVAIGIIDGVAHLVDRHGYVIGPTGTGNDDLPVMTGLTAANREILIDDLQRGVQMLTRLETSAPEFAEQIAEVRIDGRSNVVVQTLDGGPPLYLDPRRIDRNVNRWLELGKAIQSRAGALEYVDLRWSHRITVKPMHFTKD